MKNKFTFNYSVYTSKGTRPINEDASWVGINKAGQCLAIVCDGIGSQDDSQIASLIAVEVFAKSFQRRGKIYRTQIWFKWNLRVAYNRISKKANRELNSKKIGTTLLIALITDNKVECFNLGDSRLYHYNIDNNQWAQITKDHNLYNHLLSLYEKDNNIKLESLYKQYANQLLALTRCLESNSNSHLKYDYFNFSITPSDVLFLATDGVYNYINIKTINDIISANSTNSFTLVSKSIVQQALDNKSNDNLTSVVIETRMNNDK